MTEKPSCLIHITHTLTTLRGELRFIPNFIIKSRKKVVTTDLTLNGSARVKRGKEEKCQNTINDIKNVISSPHTVNLNISRHGKCCCCCCNGVVAVVALVLLLMLVVLLLLLELVMGAKECRVVVKCCDASCCYCCGDTLSLYKRQHVLLA